MAAQTATCDKSREQISREKKGEIKRKREEERKIENFCADIFRLSAGKFNGKRRVSKSTLATPTQWQASQTNSGI